MRKLTLLLVLVAFTISGFTQNYAEKRISRTIKDSELVSKNKSNKEFGDIFWIEDFNGTTDHNGITWESTVETDGNGVLLNPSAPLPAGWKIVDNNDLDYFWHWSDHGPRGVYIASPFNQPNANPVTALGNVGASADNGFMILENDYFNTTEGGAQSSNPIDMDAYIQYGPIDMSAQDGAIFNIKTIYILCCDPEAYVGLQISNDYNPTTEEGTWHNYQLNIETINNAWTYGSERDFHVNVSKHVANQSNVYFRIVNTKASSYCFLIDDIAFYEPPTSDLIVTDSWADYMYDAEDPDFVVDSDPEDAKINFWGGYTQIPQSLVSNFVKFRSAVINNGTTEATNAKVNVSITKDDNQVYAVASEGKNIEKFINDTLKVTADYTPANKGHYQVSMTVTMNETDLAPDDNSWNYDFEVVDNIYSRVYHGNESEDFDGQGPRDWASGGYDSDVCAQPYDFTDVGNLKVKGLKVWFMDHEDLDEELAAIENGDFAMIARLYFINDEGQLEDKGIASEVYTLESSDLGTWITLNFKDEGNLTIESDQTYYAGIETYTGTEQELAFQIGADNSVKQPVGGGLIYMSSLGSWYRTGHNYAIDLVLDITPSVELTFNVDMSTYSGFDASTEKVYVEGSFGTEKVEMTTTDDVNYTATVSVAANTTYTYKYSTTTMTEAANRNVAVEEANAATDDEFIPVGINDNTAAHATVYPNPFNSSLTVADLNDVNQIIISNMIGQTVMTINVDKETVIIPTSDLQNGIYMISIIDNNNNIRTDRIVKQ